jgi:hypothetical protein
MPQPESRPSAEDLVATYWPHPHYDRDAVVSALSTAAELARFAVHATEPAHGTAGAVPRVTDVQEAAYHLAQLASRLSPLARRLSDRLTTLAAEDPTLYAHDGEASTHTAAAAADLTRAMSLTEELARAFNGAFQKLGPVNHRDVSEQD